MASSSHTIYRQQLRLRLPAAANSLQLQREAEQALLAPELLTALSAELDQALAGLPPGTWLTIDQLTLEAGTLHPTGLAGQLRALLPNLLRQQLQRGATQPPNAVAVDAPGIPSPAEDAALLTTQPPEQAAGAAWVFYLVRGHLPPHWPMPASLRTWEAQLQPLLAAPPAGLAAALQQALRRPVARQRLLRQFSPALVAQALLVLLPAGQVQPARLARVLAELLRAAPPGSATANVAGEAVAEALIARALEPAAGLDWAVLLASPPKALWKRQGPNTWAWLLTARLLSSSANLSKEQEQSSPHAAHSPMPQPSQLPGELASALPSASPLPPAASATSRPLQTSLGAAPASLAEEATGVTEYITNAGVVLLHPFLSACFASCGWLDSDNQFVSPEAQSEAALLVHFLATGRAAPAPAGVRHSGRFPAAPPPTETEPQRPRGRPRPVARGTAALGRVARHHGRRLARSVSATRRQTRTST
jgi:hypothetical protein